MGSDGRQSSRGGSGRARMAPGLLVAAVCGAAGMLCSALMTGPGVMRGVLAADEPVAGGGAEVEMMKKLDRIMERLERLSAGMGHMPGGPDGSQPPDGPLGGRRGPEGSWEPGMPRGPGAGRGPDGPRGPGWRREPPAEMLDRMERSRDEAERRLREMPPEQRERIERMMAEGQRRMEEGRRRFEQAEEKFREMERRIERLEAEVARLKRPAE